MNKKSILIKLPVDDTEWAVVKRLRQKYFFDNVPVKDPYQWTFDHPHHHHWIIYENDVIVGYTHVQCWPDQRAIMRIIVVVEASRHQGYGKALLEHAEHWLRDNGYRSLHVEAAPKALPFYLKYGYMAMAVHDPEGHETHSQDTALGKILD